MAHLTDTMSEITEEMIYIAFTEGRYGTHISKWAHTPFEGCIAYTRAASPDQTNGLLAGLTRPIIGIGNRAAQEVFDIMVDRISTALASTPTARIEESELTSETLAEKNVDGMDVIEGIVADAAVVEGIQNVHEGASYYAERVIRRAIEQGTLRATAEAVRRNRSPAL